MNIFALMATLGLDSSEYDKGLSKAKSAGSALGSGLASAAKVGLAAVTAATTAVTGFAAKSVTVGESFDKSMSQVAATMGKSMDQMQNEVGSVMLTVNGQTKKFSGTLREFAQEMGRNTAFSATQAADALNYMALAGYDAQTSMNMLPNVLNLAASGNMDLARASDMVTDTQTAFGISLERTGQMVDEMAKAASTGNTSVEQLGDAFLVVGGLAQELNGGMVTLKDGSTQTVDGVQELEIALTAMANAGVKGSEAGTHMRNMLLKLSDPTKDGVAALKSMGVTIFDTEGNMRSLSDIFGDLSTEMDKMTQEDKIGVISDLFNTRDMASAEALLNAVNQDWDKIGESILNAEGAAQQMADTQLDNLAGDITIFKSALEGAQIAISDALTPALREFVQFGTNGLSQLTSAFQEGGVSGAMEAFGGILSEGLNMIIEKLPQFTEAGISMLGALGQGIIDNLPMIVEATSTVATQLIDGLMNGIPMIIEVVVAIVGALGQAIINSLPEIVNGALQLITGFAQGLLDALPVLVEQAPVIIKALADGLIQAIGDLAAVATDLIVGFALAFTDPDTLYALLEAGLDIIVALVDGIINALPQLIDTIPQIISNLVTTLIASLPKILEAGVQILLALIKGIVTTIPQLIAMIPELILAIVGGLTRGIAKIIEVGRDLVAGLWQGIKDRWTRLVEDFKGLASGLVNKIKGLFGVASPSKVFAEIGANLDAGLANGIVDNMDMVDNAMDSFNDYTTGSFIGEVKPESASTPSTSSDNRVVELLTAILEKEPVQIGANADGIFNLTRRKANEYHKAYSTSAFA